MADTVATNPATVAAESLSGPHAATCRSRSVIWKNVPFWASGA